MTANKPFDRKNFPEAVWDRLSPSLHILPHENAKAFMDLFDAFVKYADPQTMPDLLEVHQVTLLHWETLRYYDMKIAILRNNRRAAVEHMIVLTHEAGPLHSAHAGVRNDAHIKAKHWLTDASHRTAMSKTFEAAGYAPNAVEAEAFSRSLPSLASIERLLASAEKRLATLLKSIEKRSEARAAALRLATSEITKPPTGTAG